VNHIFCAQLCTLFQLFKAHMDYVERTKVLMTSDKSADNSVNATPKRFTEL